MIEGHSPQTEARLESAHRSPLRRQLLAGMPVSERQVFAADIATAVLEGGDGPPIVLLHGPGAFAATWMRIIPGLVESHRVIAPDLPGHGASHVGPGTLGTGRMLAWLGELIAETCSTPPILVGHLLGGAIAARFAIRDPDRMRRVVLVDTYGLGRFRPALKFAFAILGFMGRPTTASQSRLFRQCFVDLDAMRSTMNQRWDLIEAYALECACTAGARRNTNALMRELAVPRIPPAQLARLTVPVTLIWGRHDRQVRVSLAAKAAARFGWPLHVIEAAGDDPALEQPEAFLEALRMSLEAT